MVKKIAFAAVFGALFLLTSCNPLYLFLVSVFPVTETQTLARVDLSSLVPQDRAKDFRLSEVVVPPDRIYVLCSDQNHDGTALIVFDEDLTIVQRMTHADLSSWAGGSFNGTYAMVDDTGGVVVGNVRFALQPDGSLAPTGASMPVPLNNHGFGIPGAPGENIVDIHSNNGNLICYAVYPSAWSGARVDKTCAIAYTNSYGLRAVFVDPDATGNVVLVLRRETPDDEDNGYSLVKIPKTHFKNSESISDPLIPELGPPPYPTANIEDAAAELFGYWHDSAAGDRLVRYDHDSGDFVLFDVLGNGHEDHETFHLRDADTDVKTVYAVAGDFSYTYDYKTRTVVKLATWWTK